MKKAALVLSGGGSLGAAHIGALRVLEQEFEFDFLAGVSAGAIVAAAYACGKRSAEISEFLQKQKFFSLALDHSKNAFGYIKGKKVEEVLSELFGGTSFEDLPGIDLFIGATDFQNGNRVVLSSGSITQAVRASISVPVLFEPFFVKGKWLVDGGLTQNFPLDLAIENYEGDIIIGVDVATAMNENEDFMKTVFFKGFKSLQRSVERTIRIFFRNQQHFPEDPRVRVIRPKLDEYFPFDLRKLTEIEACGDMAALEFMKGIR